MKDCPEELKQSCESRVECMITKKCPLAWQRMWAHTIEGVTSYKFLTMSNAHRALQVLSVVSCKPWWISWGIQRMYLLQLLVFGLIERHGMYCLITPLGLAALEKLNRRMKKSRYKWQRPSRLIQAHLVFPPTIEKQFRVEVDVVINRQWLEHAKKCYW